MSSIRTRCFATYTLPTAISSPSAASAPVRPSTAVNRNASHVGRRPGSAPAPSPSRATHGRTPTPAALPGRPSPLATRAARPSPPCGIDARAGRPRPAATQSSARPGNSPRGRTGSPRITASSLAITSCDTSSASAGCTPHPRHHSYTLGRYRPTNSSHAAASAGSLRNRSSRLTDVCESLDTGQAPWNRTGRGARGRSG